MMNEFLVGTRGYGLTFMVVVSRLGFELPRRKALELAAWIVTLADPKGDEFDEICRQIEDS
jgi:hypothetical protein